MKYNEKYDRWFTKGGLVYRYSKRQDKLILCSPTNNGNGYLTTMSNYKRWSIHRALYETFVGDIPDGYQIDHINTIRDDNRLENLRCVTPKENMNNPLTLKVIRKLNKIKNKNRCNTTSNKRNRGYSEFGIKYVEHFGYGKYNNPKQYDRERSYWKRNNKCSWEKPDEC